MAVNRVDVVLGVSVSAYETGVSGVRAVEVVYEKSPGAVGRKTSLHYAPWSLGERLLRLGVERGDERAPEVWREVFGEKG